MVSSRSICTSSPWTDWFNCRYGDGAAGFPAAPLSHLAAILVLVVILIAVLALIVLVLILIVVLVGLLIIHVGFLRRFITA